MSAAPALRIIERTCRALPASPDQRGYQPVHTSGCRCPACGRSHWYVGRHSAECGFCSTAIPLAAA